MLLLGCVKSVQEFQLIVSLANGLHGAVSIVDISESYTALLHKVANGDKIDEVCSQWYNAKINKIVSM